MNMIKIMNNRPISPSRGKETGGDYRGIALGVSVTPLANSAARTSNSTRVKDILMVGSPN